MQDGLPVYSIGNTVCYIFRATAKYQPALLWWSAAMVAVRVLTPVLAMYLPSTIVAQLTAGEPPRCV